MKMNKKGFTLIEMLVVVAIIAVLVAIVIPVVGNSTEQAKEAADAANIRAAIAQVTTTALQGGTVTPVEVKMTQGTDGFASAELESIGGLNPTQFGQVENATKGEKVTIGWDTNTLAITVTVANVS